MSLDITPDSLYREVEAARVYWEKANTLGARMIGRYTSPAYMGSDGTPAPENYHFKFVQHTMARLTMGRIEPRFTSKRREASERVRGLEDFCRRWVHDTNWEAESEKAKLDMCFYGSGVAVFAQKARRGYEQFDDPPNTPQGSRLPPGMFGCDPLASAWEEIRLAYHIIVDFKNDLIKEAETDKGGGWDIQAVKNMVESGSFANSLRQKPEYAINRKEVARYSIWVPGYELPENDPFWKGMGERERMKYHGTVFTLAACMSDGHAGSTPKFIRKPRGYFGPRQGPYCFAGFLTVPDQVRRLSPLVANDGQIEELNAQVRANDMLAREAKTGFVMNGTAQDAVQQILNFKHGQALVVPGFDKAMFERMEVGGPGPESLAREKELRARVSRSLSIPDLAAGEVTGTGTATENALAGQQMDITADYLDRKALSLDEQMILHVAWAADQDDSSTVQTDSEVLIGGSSPEEHSRGIDRIERVGMIDQETALAMKERVQSEPEAPAGSFDDLDIRIERVRSDPQSRAKLAEAWNLALQVSGVLPVIGQYAPGLPALMERSADELSVAELSTLFDLQAAVQVGEAQQEAAQAEPPRSIQGPKPASPGGGSGPGGFKRQTQNASPAAQAVKLRTSAKPAKAGKK